jgi:hypothetical protein
VIVEQRALLKQIWGSFVKAYYLKSLQLTSVEDVIKSAWNWHKNNPDGF